MAGGVEYLADLACPASARWLPNAAKTDRSQPGEEV
jgi:hypothetical protein